MVVVLNYLFILLINNKITHSGVFFNTKNRSGYGNFSFLKDGKNLFNKSVWSISTSVKNRNHVATFPESLVKPCILSSTNENDFILDPFWGSGTVGKLCEKYNRRFVGIEINECYVSSFLNTFKSAPYILKY